VSSAAAPGKASQEPRPPLIPRWVYEPWIWEDSNHTADGVRDLVNGYRSRGIPVGAVIIDSPWQTNHNTFEFGANYPDPRGLINELHGQGIKVLFWVTCMINVSSFSGPERGKAANYDEAAAAGYFVNGGQLYRWHHGYGSAIDFFNPAAVEWWFGQMDRAFSYGIDGWKVDNADIFLWKPDADGREPETVQTAAGPKTMREYSDAYYRAFYRFVHERNAEAAIMARPFDADIVFAPVDAVHAGWVGDQGSNWGGLAEALDYMLQSARLGYAAVGSDVGGNDPTPDVDFNALFARWTQVGAFSPLMENGGKGEHRPWMISDQAVDIYRYYAKLHHQLVPYHYSAGVHAHRTGQPIIRNVQRGGRQYVLGDDFFVAPMVVKGTQRDFKLPPGRWHDYWDDDSQRDGSATVRYTAPLERIPLFIRAGAIIPMQVADSETGHGGAGSAGHLTLLVYPEGESSRVYYPDASRSVELRASRGSGQVVVQLGAQTERYVLRIKQREGPAAVTLERGTSTVTLQPLPAWGAFDSGGEGWFFDPDRRYLWVRFATDNSPARLSYASP
jgi:alpha-D-xyloside xylohydrolase